MVVMLSQQLSGINIIALLATTFFSTGELRTSSPIEAQTDSYKLAIGFGAANSVFSMIAYFLVENKEEQCLSGSQPCLLEPPNSLMSRWLLSLSLKYQSLSSLVPLHPATPFAAIDGCCEYVPWHHRKWTRPVSRWGTFLRR